MTDHNSAPTYSATTGREGERRGDHSSYRIQLVPTGCETLPGVCEVVKYNLWSKLLGSDLFT